MHDCCDFVEVQVPRRAPGGWAVETKGTSHKGWERQGMLSLENTVGGMKAASRHMQGRHSDQELSLLSEALGTDMSQSVRQKSMQYADNS